MYFLKGGGDTRASTHATSHPDYCKIQEKRISIIIIIIMTIIIVINETIYYII